jgi:hypothetical protein
MHHISVFFQRDFRKVDLFPPSAEVGPVRGFDCTSPCLGYVIHCPLSGKFRLLADLVARLLRDWLSCRKKAVFGLLLHAYIRGHVSCTRNCLIILQPLICFVFCDSACKADTSSRNIRKAHHYAYYGLLLDTWIEIHFHIIIPVMPRSRELFLPLIFVDRSVVCILLPVRAACSSWSILCVTVYTVNLLVKVLLPASCCVPTSILHWHANNLWGLRFSRRCLLQMSSIWLWKLTTDWELQISVNSGVMY